MENRNIVVSVVDDEVIEIDYTDLITEDDKPVDNLFSEKQQRLLTEALYASWISTNARPFLALANVGLFFSSEKSAIVPDMMLSLDVSAPPEVWEKQHRSYFIWKYGKPPEVVIEIVSNLKGNELGSKKDQYAKIGVAYYVVFDPAEHYNKPILRVFEKKGFEYFTKNDTVFEDLGIALTLWEGEYEGLYSLWLRWTDLDDQLILTGKERAEMEFERAESEIIRAKYESKRAEREFERAEMEFERAEKLAQKLRALGINPDE
jgi:Uma2 family endonuclease